MPALIQFLLHPLLGLGQFQVLIHVALHGTHAEFGVLSSPAQAHTGCHLCNVGHVSHASHVAHLFQQIGHVVYSRHFLHFVHQIAGLLHDLALFDLPRFHLGVQLLTHALHDPHELARVLEQVLKHGLHRGFVRRVQIQLGRSLLRNFFGQAADFSTQQPVQMLVHGIRVHARRQRDPFLLLI